MSNQGGQWAYSGHIQTQGFMRSIATLLGIVIAAPDFSTLSRRVTGPTLPVTRKTDRSGPVHLVVDSAGLKVFGGGALSAACCAFACRVI